MTQVGVKEKEVEISTAEYTLLGNLAIVQDSRGLVLFAHGSGSSRFSKRNRYVASHLQEGGLSTLLFDLLTAEEERIDNITRALRFDIEMLGERLGAATDWILDQPGLGGMSVGYFGSSTGAAAALIAAAERPDVVDAVVSRGGRPDLAKKALPAVQQPTLLIVGGRDTAVIGMNEDARDQMKDAGTVEIEIVPGATHLFEEPGALEQVADLARQWFVRYLG
ncbi:MAG TPA: dienelactone hydrolase family protein [Candidatus Binatia bacterium]|nr:dienelactone hydrolase family protein [Candidatus Binatia bacterium]